MRVSVSEVSRALDDLLEGRRTREEIADWAASAQKADDTGTLEYVPNTDEKQIWTGILFLIGVDLKVGAASYLHNREDFERFKADWDGAVYP